MTFTKKPSQPGFGTWYVGKEEFDTERDLVAWVKVMDEPSETYGIDGGRIIKLTIQIGKEYIAVYERGWDTPVSEEAQPLYESILAQFN